MVLMENNLSRDQFDPRVNPNKKLHNGAVNTRRVGMRSHERADARRVLINDAISIVSSLIPSLISHFCVPGA